MKYFIETYGCQMNVHDSERMAGLLEASGYEPAHDDLDADLVVINTCSVREKAEDKLYTRLGHLKGLERATGHAPLVAVAGCVAQQEGAKLRERSDLIDIVVGTQRVKMLPMLVERARGERSLRPSGSPLDAIVDVDTPYDEPSFPLGLTRHADAVKAYVTIIEGCNDFCSFCVVPYTRGHERMRPKAEILREVAEASRGFVYCVATYGVTGERDHLSETAADLVARLRPLTGRPLLVGVGIGSPDQAALACGFADGVVVGSALVRPLLAGDRAGALELAERFRAAIAA